MKEPIQNLTEEQFHAFCEAATTDRPLLVDFWAEWCGPCKALAPLLEEVAEEFGDRLTVAKVNVDEQAQLARKFNVQSIPLLCLFVKGSLVDHRLGAISKSEIEDLIRGH